MKKADFKIQIFTTILRYVSVSKESKLKEEFQESDFKSLYKSGHGL